MVAACIHAGEAAPASAIDPITITSDRGDVNSDWCSGGSACAIDMAALRGSAKGSARGPQLIGAIPLNLHLPDDAAGKVEIRAEITADSRLITARLELDVRGAASGIALASAPPIVHHHATPEDDDRDIAIIPARTFDSQQWETSFPSGGASASAPFLVVGAAAGIEVVAAEPLGIWRTFEFRVRVTDGDGNPVADGTPVWWEARTQPAGRPKCTRSGRDHAAG